jgi:histidyl-tRNA synthetase
MQPMEEGAGSGGSVAVALFTRIFTMIVSVVWGIFIGYELVKIDIMYIDFKSDILTQYYNEWDNGMYVHETLEEKARKACRLRNFHEIRTPVFEHTELFTRSIGQDTDVVGKEMYTFLDKGERSITLKPEGTAPVARSFVENSLDALSLPLKMFYITPVFRYENPQHGRLREHHQFGVEVYGGDTPYLDLEVIKLAYGFLTDMGVKDLSLNLNNIGCPVCRKKYNEVLKQYLNSHYDKLCSTCKERLIRNPLRILDCKVPSCGEIVKNAPVITDYVCEDCKNHTDKLCSLLESAKIPFKVNPQIVRGLDYYTKTVFEFVSGSVGTVCGGGRYNNLVESIGGKPTPCVGFGMGIDRLTMLLLDLPNLREAMFIFRGPDRIRP